MSLAGSSRDFWSLEYGLQTFQRMVIEGQIDEGLQISCRESRSGMDIYDGFFVTAHQHSAGAASQENQGIGDSRGGKTTKIHMAVDGFGLPLVFSFGRFEKQNTTSSKRKANTFDFLGITHYCDKTKRGHFKVGRKTSAKKFRAKAKELNQWLKAIRNLVLTKDWWKTLSSKLRGHYEYYGVSENYASIHKFYTLAIRLARKWMNRRSQKRTMSLVKMNNYLQLYPLPKPSIRDNFYAVT